MPEDTTPSGPRSSGTAFRDRNIAATYDYRDGQGALRFQVVRRHNPKGFSQRQPDGKGGWVWDLQGVERVLYRYPELLAADPDAWVLIAEGEKDCDRLTKLDFVATTNPGGASKWRDEFTEDFRGRRVCILPDNDDPGRKHAAQVAQSLRGKAAEVRVLDLPGLPPKGDVSDWLDADGSAEKLTTLIDEAPTWERAGADDDRLRLDLSLNRVGRIITATDLAERAFPEPRYAVTGMVPEGATLLVGKPKLGKSWLLLNLGIAVAKGGYALGKISVEQGDVLLMSLEDNERRLQERLLRILDGEAAPARLHLVTEWPRLDQGGDGDLSVWLREHPETRLVGIDVLARLRPPGSTKDNLYLSDYRLLASLKEVADEHKVALVAVHHTRKASAEDPLDSISGTSGLAAAADTALILTRERGRADGNLYVRGRDVPEREYALGFDEVTCAWTVMGDASEFRRSAQRAQVVDLLRERGPLGPKEIAEGLGADRGNIRVMLHRMSKAGDVLVLDGTYSVPRVTGETPWEKDAATQNLPVTPSVTEQGGVTGEGCATAQEVVPVTPVTAHGDVDEVLRPAQSVPQEESPLARYPSEDEALASTLMAEDNAPMDCQRPSECGIHGPCDGYIERGGCPLAALLASTDAWGQAELGVSA